MSDSSSTFSFEIKSGEALLLKEGDTYYSPNLNAMHDEPLSFVWKNRPVDFYRLTFNQVHLTLESAAEQQAGIRKLLYCVLN